MSQRPHERLEAALRWDDPDLAWAEITRRLEGADAARFYGSLKLPHNPDVRMSSLEGPRVAVTLTERGEVAVDGLGGERWVLTDAGLQKVHLDKPAGPSLPIPGLRDAAATVFTDLRAVPHRDAGPTEVGRAGGRNTLVVTSEDLEVLVGLVGLEIVGVEVRGPGGRPIALLHVDHVELNPTLPPNQFEIATPPLDEVTRNALWEGYFPGCLRP